VAGVCIWTARAAKRFPAEAINCTGRANDDLARLVGASLDAVWTDVLETGAALDHAL